jgi:endonuclease YncB( thermonuclease family)
MIRKLGLLAVLLLAALLASCWESVETSSAEVVGVDDGDSFTVLRNQEEQRVRLQGIDAPERGQAFANRARQHLSGLVYGKMVEIEHLGEDRYGRILARVRVGDVDVNLRMVDDGYAWHFKRYSTERALARAERRARRARRGLWVDPDPVPPWEWRRSER